VTRVYELAACYDEISVEAAQRLVAIWHDADPREPEPARQPASTRRAPAEPARPAALAAIRRLPDLRDRRLRGVASE
jgi:hypothetical protein